jgi:hypothetical protein
MYEKYINLGFQRLDIEDTVEFKRNGYSGFLLIKKFKHASITVHWMDLDKPELWVKNMKFKITFEQIEEAINKNK